MVFSDLWKKISGRRKWNNLIERSINISGGQEIAIFLWRKKKLFYHMFIFWSRSLPLRMWKAYSGSDSQISGQSVESLIKSKKKKSSRCRSTRGWRSLRRSRGRASTSPWRHPPARRLWRAVRCWWGRRRMMIRAGPQTPKCQKCYGTNFFHCVYTYKWPGKSLKVQKWF